MPKNYNSLKYLERVYAGDGGDSAGLINHAIYKKMMPCPLRSQIESTKTRVTVSVADGKDPRDTDVKLDYIQSFIEHVNPQHIKKDLESEIQATKWLVEEIRHRKKARAETGQKIRLRRKAYMEKMKRKSTQFGASDAGS